MKKEIKVNDGLIFKELGGTYQTACMQKPDGMPKDWFSDFCEKQVFAQAVNMFSEIDGEWGSIPADLYIDGNFVEHEEEKEENWADADIDEEGFKKIESATKNYLKSYADTLRCTVQEVVDMGADSCFDKIKKSKEQD